ncbi:reverse transcriptase domain-containing protein [Tanacetum coccineum]
MTLASSAEKPSKTFDELMSTLIDFSAFIMNGLKIKNLTQETLSGLAFRLPKGTRSNYAELEYDFEQCYKDLLEKLDWENPEGGNYPFDLTKPLPLVMSRNHQKYLLITSSTMISSICKEALKTRFQIYGFLLKPPMICMHYEVEVMRKHGHASPCCLESAYKSLDVFDFAIALRMFTRSLVIQKRVEDLQLGVESYQKRSTSPGHKLPYPALGKETHKLYKFSDRTLTRLQTSLDDITKNIQMEYLPKRCWSRLEKKRANIMIKVIDKQLKERRFNTTAGNPIKEILLKLNLPDHRSILTDLKEHIKMDMEPLLKRSRSELHINGKIDSSAGTRQQASEKILPSTPNYSGHRSAHKAIERSEEDDPDTAMEVEEELPEPWILLIDGSSCVDGSGVGLILTNPEGVEFTYALRFRFKATNNEAEYEALIAGLRIAEEMGVKNLLANVDSRLVANQVNGTYIANEADRIRYLEKVRTLTNGFRMFSIKQVPRSENKKADALSKIASTSFAHLIKQVLVKELKEKSINELEVLAVVEEEGNTWMALIYEYLTEETLSTEVYRLVPRNPQQKLTPITSPWPFYKWGIDIARPFPEGPGKVKFLIVAIDYFTKWIEANPVATITGNQVKKFVWDNIVYRFGLPREIISDNGKQFRDNPFKDWCEKLCIRQCFASVKHPQANGLVERANHSLGEGIKARLYARSKN